jgi:hypothetical protein
MSPKANWSNTHTTNLLLFVIAILLLVLVVQNGSKGPVFPTDLSPNFPAMDTASKGHGNPEDMESSSVMFAAFSCPENSSLALSDSSCLGSKADERRETIKKVFEQNLPISQVFDQVVAKFGEDALTPEAREIRKNRPTQ